MTMVIDCDIGNSPFSGGAVHPLRQGSKTGWLESWGVLYISSWLYLKLIPGDVRTENGEGS